MSSLHPIFLYAGLPVILALGYWVWNYYAYPLYRYSSLRPLSQLKNAARGPKLFLFLARLAALAALCFSLARFRTPDERSKLPVEGVDIIIDLDISGSMNLYDDLQDKRTRLEVAKAEALKFIAKRDYDPIGLVIFSGIAVSRCPLTLDRTILKEIIDQTSTQTIQADGTVLSRSLVTAINRLKKSLAKSKVIIMLTDGEPSAGDISPSVPVELAKKLGIKIYTIGIGSEKESYMDHPFYGTIPVRSTLNVQLLNYIANQTGGRFFHARNPADMKQIYDTIDTLERTSYQAPVFSRYFEYFLPFLWLALLLLCFEILLATTVWVRL